MNITKLTATFGVQIEGVKLGKLSHQEFADIKAAWHKHRGLIAFKQAFVTDDELLAFSRLLGALDSPPNQEHGRQSPVGYPEIYVVSNVKDNAGKPIGALGDGEAVWHTDMSYELMPPLASMLTALEIPDAGGDTWFCDMSGIYQDLPVPLQQRLASLQIKHDGTYNSGGYLRAGVAVTDDPVTAPGTLHPAVIVIPETQTPALYLGRRRMAYVAGLSREDSEELLNTLWAYTSQEHRVYKHQWQVGDLVLWDNRCTMHRRDSFPATQRRVMHRTQISGQSRPRIYSPGA